MKPVILQRNKTIRWILGVILVAEAVLIGVQWKLKSSPHVQPGELNRLGMMVDISHVSDKTFYDALETSAAPLIASHSSCRALADVPRNMTDDMLRAVARNSWVDPSRAPLILTLVLAAYLLVRGIRIALRAARLRTTRYRLTNQRLVVESGLVSRTLGEVDLRSVEDLVFRQGPMERLLGIGRVSVVSSDRNAPRLLLVGVKDPKGTRELIRTQAYAATQRQLFTRST